MTRSRILLADDHALVREGIVRLLETDFDIAGHVGDGRALVQEAVKLRPHVVVFDVAMPLLNGIEAAKQIRTALPLTKMVALSQQSSKDYVRAAFRAGAAAYVLKNAAAAELLKALREVLAGRVFLSPELQRQYGDPGLIRADTKTELFGDPLTPRQREVLQLIAEGKSAKEIAGILGISTKTVEFHKASIVDELGLRTTAELTRYAIEQGIAPK